MANETQAQTANVEVLPPIKAGSMNLSPGVAMFGCGFLAGLVAAGVVVYVIRKKL